MKKTALLLFFLLLIPAAIADDFLYDYEKAKLSIDISSDIAIKPTSSNYNVQYIKAGLSFFPREDWQQAVLNLETTPASSEKENELEFRWDNPETAVSFKVNADIEIKTDMPRITKKVEFPIKELPQEYVIYTKPSKNIDSDSQDIINLASSLVEGEDDLYIAVFKIGRWVKGNVNYDLNTLTASVSQPASWVLKNREGVCDEITTLFIAMLRSLSIPARYISGVAYTNYNGKNDFGAHAWAEVYFPEFGWVPYDLTYGEFAFIDATHIKLKESTDSDETTTRFEWLGTNINIEASELEIKAKVLEKIGEKPPLITLKSAALKNPVEFGSYNLIETEIENLNNYYVTEELTISKTNELETPENRKTVALKPYEKKKVYWTEKITGDLEASYIYTFPVSVSSTRNETSSTEFKSSFGSPFYSEEDINDMLSQKQEEEKKTYSRNIELACHPGKEEYYMDEKPLINCSMKNTGNILLKELNVCLGSDCEETDLGINQKKEMGFLLELGSAGKKDVIVTASNKEISKTANILITALDAPKIGIGELDYPASVSYNEVYSVSFTLKKISLSSPIDVVIELKNGFSKEWVIEELNSDQKFILNLNGNELNPGENMIKIVAGYKDKRNNKYQETKEFSIKLENVTFSQRIMIFFRNIGRIFS